MMNGKDYYQLWFDESDPCAAICGSADLKGMSEYFIYNPEPVGDWPEGITFYCEGKWLEDYLFATTVDWILVSERVRRALMGLGVHGVQFLPIQVVRKETGEGAHTYYVLHTWIQLSALEEQHTTYLEPRDSEYPELSIAKVALDRRAIRDADVFRLRERNVSLYVSRRVRECLETIGATGFRWIPVRAY